MDSKRDRCVSCPKGTYANLHGSTECSVCPGKSTTTFVGATMESDCKGIFILRLILGALGVVVSNTENQKIMQHILLRCYCSDCCC